jgi:hypothetical protein
MASRRVASAATFLICLLIVHASTRASADSTGRADALRRARIWTAVAVERMDLKAGPADPRGFPFLATVACQYENTKLRGHSLKFACAIAPGHSVKVKVGASNGEVFAEVAASRLLWALGFGADHMYPVRLRCHGCPPRFGGRHTSSGDDIFDPAVIERPLEGAVFAGHDGWGWWELDRVDPHAGGASRRSCSTPTTSRNSSGCCALARRRHAPRAVARTPCSCSTTSG